MKLSNIVSHWNRRFHIHLGLFLLLFTWLFSLSGLLLNHGDWKFASFWEERQEETNEFTFPMDLLNKPDLEQEVMVYLKIEGELQKQNLTDEVLEFRVQSSGKVREVHLQLNNGSGTQKVITFNFWGQWRTLHTFNGVNKGDVLQDPTWWITQTWKITMDGMAIGLILICITSWIMWFKVRKEYRVSYWVILASVISASYFLWWG